MAERKARHDRYAEIAAEKAPKSMSLQEQAKAIAEPLEHLENSIEFLARFRRYFDDNDVYSGAEDSEDASSDTSYTIVRTDHDYISAPSEIIVESQTDNNNSENLFSCTIAKSQRQERRGRKRERRARALKKRKRSADVRRFDNMMVDLRKARKSWMIAWWL